MKNNDILREIKNAFRDYDIDLQIQPAHTTASVYIKFDYGMIGSLRIGDHPGKPPYNYKYEIGSFIKKTREYHSISKTGKKFPKYEFTPEDVAALIVHIKVERWNIIMKYGRPKYDNWKAEKKAHQS